mmetsp:Transcript_24161/g.75863  ORF Transcript_24161/g.75863 Transcript_24161/m.75863 type:complete len:214 (-) Transcript_24161:273-914(-)
MGVHHGLYGCGGRRHRHRRGLHPPRPRGQHVDQPQRDPRRRHRQRQQRLHRRRARLRLCQRGWRPDGRPWPRHALRGHHRRARQQRPRRRGGLPPCQDHGDQVPRRLRGLDLQRHPLRRLRHQHGRPHHLQLVGRRRLQPGPLRRHRVRGLRGRAALPRGRGQQRHQQRRHPPLPLQLRPPQRPLRGSLRPHRPDECVLVLRRHHRRRLRPWH